MKTKMYLATKKVDVMFLLEPEENLEKEAKYFLNLEEKNVVPGRITIKEITSIDDVPADWRDSNLWGTGSDITPLEFLQDPEYAEYLRLKEKFEGK